MDDIITYAQNRLDEAERNDEDAVTVRYWVGYLDGVMAVFRAQEDEPT